MSENTLTKQKIPDIIGLFSVAYLIFASIYVYCFFSLFNFNVFPFLEIGEALQLTIFDFVVICAGIIWFSMLFQSFLDWKEKAFRFIDSIPTIMWSLGFIGQYLLWGTSDISYKLILTGFQILSAVLLRIVIFGKPNNILNFALVLCGVFVAAGFIRSKIYFDDVIKNDHFAGTYIVLRHQQNETPKYSNRNSDTIFSTSDHTYVTRTKNQYLFYDIHSRSMDIYPVSEVIFAHIYSK